MTFEEWKLAVNTAVQRGCGLCLDDLGTTSLRDWFEQGLSARKAADKAMQQAGV